VPLVPVVLALLVLLLPAPAQAAPAWVWPLAGAQQVSRPFAPGPTPYAPGHRGADLPGRAGQQVLAAGAGRVSFSGLLAGRGVLVVVHGALRTTYEPVLASVGVGQPVAAGQTIGRLVAGHGGCPVEACLHWGLRRGRDYLDPVRLVRGGPVRLLPLAGGAQGGLPAAGLLGGPGSPLLVAPQAGPARGVPTGPTPAGPALGSQARRLPGSQPALPAPESGQPVLSGGPAVPGPQAADVRGSPAADLSPGLDAGRVAAPPATTSGRGAPVLPLGLGLATGAAVLAARRYVLRRG